MNTTMESAADAAAVTTKKTAAKIAAKQQVAAEQAEAKRKTKVEKARATKEVAEDAAPAHTTKEEAPVIIWPGLTVAGLGSAWKAQAAPPEPQMPPVPWL